MNCEANLLGPSKGRDPYNLQKMFENTRRYSFRKSHLDSWGSWQEPFFSPFHHPAIGSLAPRLGRTLRRWQESLGAKGSEAKRMDLESTRTSENGYLRYLKMVYKRYKYLS